MARAPEQSLVIAKPDAVRDGRAEEIRAYLEERGMSVIDSDELLLSADGLRALYANVQISDESFSLMVSLYAMSPAALLHFVGEGAVAVGREAKAFFREKYNYGYYGSTIHASDSEEECLRELDVLSNYRAIGRIALHDTAPPEV